MDMSRVLRWQSIYMGKDGTRTMIDILYKLFRDVGVLETMTNDGGPEFKSEKLCDLLQVPSQAHLSRVCTRKLQGRCCQVRKETSEGEHVANRPAQQ